MVTALCTDHGLLFFNEDSGDVAFCCNEMRILSVNLNNINHDNNFDKDDLDTNILIRLLACHSKFKNAKHLKKDKWRVNVNDMDNFYMSKDEEKEIETIFTE